MIFERNKDTMSRAAYIKMREEEFKISRRLAYNPYQSNLMDNSLQKYVLDPNYRQQFVNSL